ncbi:MAG: MarR family transcriptional regulator [Ruminococcaceae bacterium]|nr:MarR family transcriptional regulator [Oscillospiraceae bacterium]
MAQRYEQLKLENQLCFPLYACAKEIVRRYQPSLDPLDLTYTQYLVMMALWEYDAQTVKELGRRLRLDSGTLTPVLKKLEGKGYVSRCRSADDERSVVIIPTEEGRALSDRAAGVPMEIGSCVKLTPEEAIQLHTLLYRVLAGMEEEEHGTQK